MDDVIIVLSDDESCTEVKMDPDEAALLEHLKERERKRDIARVDLERAKAKRKRMKLLEVKIENVDKEIADLVEQRKQIDGGMDIDFSPIECNCVQYTYCHIKSSCLVKQHKLKFSLCRCRIRGLSISTFHCDRCPG